MWHLVCLLIVCAFLAVFTGPASAITMIPQLGWWHTQDLIGPLQYHDQPTAPAYSVYIPTNMFPPTVDRSDLPGSFCDYTKRDVNETGPSTRMAEV
jgi:hypothetical protein